MPTAFESALLSVQLFELRREPVLREARRWFIQDFTPESFAELVEAVSGERNASFRMVLGYWDMAASLVTSGAIDGRCLPGGARRGVRDIQQDPSLSCRTAHGERGADVLSAPRGRRPRYAG